MRYPIVIHKDESSSYGVTVPDLPGCFSGGDTLEATFDMSREAIVGHIETLLMDGQDIPEQHPLQVHQANPDFAGGIWALVEVDISRLDKAVRLNITIPANILTTIDAAARRCGESRSAFLARGALHLISHEMEMKSLTLPK